MDLSSKRIKELNEICKQFGIRTGGRKADIIDRIQAHPAYNEHINGQNGTAKNYKRSTPTKRSATDALDDNEAIAKKPKNHPEQTEKARNSLFDRFQDPDAEEDEITEDGIVALCSELGIDPEDPVILVLSWHMDAKNMCIYTRNEFLKGLAALECQSTEDLRQKLPFLRSQLQSKHDFPSIYSYSYSFARDASQKSLSKDIALGLWALLLPNRFALLQHWIQFVKETYHNSISKDIWMQVLEFANQIPPDLSDYDDENGAWPVLIDDFVAYMRPKIQAQGLAAILEQEKKVQTQPDDDGDQEMRDA